MILTLWLTGKEPFSGKCLWAIKYIGNIEDDHSCSILGGIKNSVWHLSLAYFLSQAHASIKIMLKLFELIYL